MCLSVCVCLCIDATKTFLRLVANPSNDVSQNFEIVFVGDIGKDAQFIAQSAGFGGTLVQTAACTPVGEVSNLDAAVSDALQILDLVRADAFVDFGYERAFNPLRVVRLVTTRARPVTGGEIRVAAEV
jgi:hypothetical protein